MRTVKASIKVFCAFLFCLFIANSSAQTTTDTPATSPLNLDWTAVYEVFEAPPGFKYYMGVVSWGELIFVGTEDFLGAETELQIFFFKGKISKSILILGPSGISEIDCFNTYRKAVNFLNKK